jgi:hypothetical protein
MSHGHDYVNKEPYSYKTHFFFYLYMFPLMYISITWNALITPLILTYLHEERSAARDFSLVIIVR